jgi:hypothetical protein
MRQQRCLPLLRFLHQSQQATFKLLCSFLGRNTTLVRLRHTPVSRASTGGTLQTVTRNALAEHLALNPDTKIGSRMSMAYVQQATGQAASAWDGAQVHNDQVGTHIHRRCNCPQCQGNRSACTHRLTTDRRVDRYVSRSAPSLDGGAGSPEGACWPCCRCCWCCCCC